MKIPAKPIRTEKKQTCGVHIRWMIRRDMPEVLQIEKSGDRGWNEEEFLEHLCQWNEIGMVVEKGEKIVGFMIYAMQKTRIDLLNFVVHPQWRHLGIGQQMIEKLVSKLSPRRSTKIVAHVHERNLAMQLFLREAGFLAKRVNDEFYVMVRAI